MSVRSGARSSRFAPVPDALKLALAHPALVRSLAVYEPVAFGVLDEPSADDDAARADLARLDLRYDGERWLAAFVDWWSGTGAWAGLGRDGRFPGMMSPTLHRAQVCALGCVPSLCLSLCQDDHLCL